MKPTLVFMLVALSTPVYAHAEPKPIELPKLIETFMTKPGTQSDWSMGADANTPQISWTSMGVDSRPNCGIYESCRRGATRVLLNGKEMQHLRQRMEPVPWELFMTSNSPAKWGPQQLTISPNCDTVQCSFDFKKAMALNEFNLTQVCQSGFANARNTAYEIKKGKKHTFVSVSENLGSGGSSTFLTLFLTPPQNLNDLCSLD